MFFFAPKVISVPLGDVWCIGEAKLPDSFWYHQLILRMDAAEGPHFPLCTCCHSHPSYESSHQVLNYCVLYPGKGLPPFLHPPNNNPSHTRCDETTFPGHAGALTKTRNQYRERWWKHVYPILLMSDFSGVETRMEFVKRAKEDPRSDHK